VKGQEHCTASVVKGEFAQSIPDRLEEFVRKYPDRVAFKTKKVAFTWDALNRSANRIAHAILLTCKSPEKPIALLLDHETTMMPATVGVLKGGGFYVPLSPSHPSVRNIYILRETEADLIVTDTNNLSLAKELAQGKSHLINIDDLDSSLSSENLGLQISPDSLAFLTYTSGSTGEPKGIMNTHRKALYRITHDRCFGMGPDDRFTQPSSAERRTPFAALLSGAGSYPWYVKEEGLEHLADWLIEEKITIYRSAPRIFRQFVSTLTGKEQFPNLRVIVLAGDPVYRTDVELYEKNFSSECLLVNTYGAHEVGPIRMNVLGKEAEISGERVPIGYEIPDREVLLLDDNGQEVGFNQVGEIAVRTRDFSPSFWRRPDLMETKFLPDPNRGDRKIYLTGDLGRMSPDGCLEHLGRKDFQVKVRGLRVEIAEVEGALRSMDAIREAAVIAREDQQGDKRLVAYIVAAGNAPLGVSEVRRFIQQKLPPLMVPSTFVMLDMLPLTPTGKVNRRALPDPGKCRPDLDTPFVPPGTPVEQELSEIWANVLSLEKVGIHDNFFDLGGHSLAATRVISRVIQNFQLELPIKALFEAPTVAEMATVITQNQRKRACAEEIAQMLREVEAMNEEEAQNQIAGECIRSSSSDRHE
jgi:amino acid adenylation domain-containing protein